MVIAACTKCGLIRTEAAPQQRESKIDLAGDCQA
jgi:hypothetical protein